MDLKYLIRLLSWCLKAELSNGWADVQMKTMCIILILEVKWRHMLLTGIASLRGYRAKRRAQPQLSHVKTFFFFFLHV